VNELVSQEYFKQFSVGGFQLRITEIFVILSTAKNLIIILISKDLLIRYGKQLQQHLG